jgi:hypothetical protein
MTLPAQVKALRQRNGSAGNIDDRFDATDSQVSRQFLTRFTTQDAPGWMSPVSLAAWLKSAFLRPHRPGRTAPAHPPRAA